MGVNAGIGRTCKARLFQRFRGDLWDWFEREASKIRYIYVDISISRRDRNFIGASVDAIAVHRATRVAAIANVARPFGAARVPQKFQR
ncbi:hypothetical protein ACU4I5_32895 (plasmid) [Ensifer adhaerens]|nr:hypothetical protein B9J07_00845 [Sinorhizobium sp. LM21]